MKVARVEPLHVRDERWLFVRLVSDTGLEGFGEASDSADDDLCAHILRERLAPRLIGRDADPVPAFERLRRMGWLPTNGHVADTAVSAIEQALWDLHARALGVPIWRVLGGKLRDTIPVYANVNRGIVSRTPEGFAAAARDAVKDGHTAVKVAPFNGVARGLSQGELRRAIAAGAERVAAVRDAIGPDVALMVDCHSRFDRDSGLLAASALQPFDLTWLEEPVRFEEDPDGLREVRDRCGIPIAAGELLPRAACYRDLAQCVDVAMADVKHCGGVSGLRAVASVCAALGVPLSPHNPSGPVATTMTLHVAASTPGIGPVELQVSSRRADAVRRIAPGAERLVGDALVVPDEPLTIR